MFSASSVRLQNATAAMTIRRACAVMGFGTPPVDKKDLRAVFLKLTKEYHPDQQGPRSSSEKMVELTEAYRLLRGLIDQRVGLGHRPATSAGSSPSTVAATAASAALHVPSFGATSEGMWLPWQREPCTQTKASDAASMSGDSPLVHEATTSFAMFVESVRGAEKRLHETRRRAQQSGQGSHGFDAAHIEHQRRLRAGERSFFTASASNVSDGNTPRRRPLYTLVWQYGRAKLRAFPGRVMRSVRFIVLGR